MGISVEWMSEDKAIIHVLFKGQWTWNDMFAAVHRQNELTAEVDRAVYTIMDLRESSLLPQKIFTNAKPMHNLLSKHIVLSVIIPNASYARTIISILFNAFPNLARNPEQIIVSTWDEALAVIAKKRGQQTLS